MKSTFVLTFSFFCLLLLLPQHSFAGELNYGRYRGLNSPRTSGGYFGKGFSVRRHNARLSTFAQKKSNPFRKYGSPVKLESSPSEKGIVKLQKEEERYDEQYYRWQLQVHKLKMKEAKRLEKQRAKEEKARQREIARQKKLAANKAKKGAGVSSSASLVPGLSNQPPATEGAPVRKPTFWERLKRALFGG